MVEQLHMEEELNKIKENPQSIDYFIKIMSQKMGSDVEQIIDQAILYYKKTEHTDIYRELIVLQAKSYRIYGAFEKGIKLGESAYDFFKTIDDQEGISTCCNILLICHMKLGRFDEAMSYAIDGLERIGQEESYSVHVQLLISIAKFYMMINEYQKARELISHVLEMENLLTAEHFISIESALLEISLREGKIEEGALHCRRAYELANKYEMDTYYKAELNEILSLRGELNVKRGLDVQAEKDLKIAYEQADKNAFIENKVKILMVWGKYLESKDEIALAKEKLNQALIENQNIGSKYLELKVYEVLEKIYQKEENWEEAYRALQKVQEYSKLIHISKTKLWIDQLNDKNRVEQITHYKVLIQQMKQVAKVGNCFTLYLKEDNIQETIHKEVAKLLDMNLMGIAFYKNHKLDYNVYDLQTGWLEGKNDLVRYTTRLVEHCIEYQEEIIVEDGNFEEYSLRTIKESESEMQLRSAFVTVLKVQGRVLGAMLIGSYKMSAYSLNDLNVARMIASYLAITLKNMNLSYQVNHLEEHDALTGVLTREAVLKYGEAIFKENHKSRKRTAFIIFETDYLKKINDKYGYQLASQVLKRVGEVINQSIRAQGYAGRYGGEAFIVILNDTNRKEVAKIAEHIKQQVENSVFETKKEKNIKVTLSGGIYLCNEYTLNLDDAIRFADHALYRAKILGRNQIMSYHLSKNSS